jgi:predicted dehydrogenase
MKDTSSPSRREFIKNSAIVTASVAGGLSLARSAHAAGSDKLRVALVGCGGRGSGAVRNCIEADPSVHVVAVADAFEGAAKSAAASLTREHPDRVDIPADRVFVGLDAYKKAIESPCEMVLFATPPGFRPFHYAAAIAAGKHVFMEKPCCVDAPGFNMLNEANKMAEAKGLKVGVGLQRHHQQNYIETMEKIHDGAIGDLICLQAYWNGSGIWNRRREPGMTEMQYQVHNWYHFAWLCGDNICEQHVHNLDVCNWAKQDHPVEANGMGGCQQRYTGGNKGTGQIFDHHFVEFTYKDGTKLISQCRQIPGCFDRVSEYAIGSAGESNLAGSIQTKAGKETIAKPKKIKGQHGGGGDPYVQEHKDLVAAIKNNEKYCEGWYGATSSFTAVLGRMATYSGKIVKWDDAVKFGTSEFPAALAWDAPAPVSKNADGDYPIPVPGSFVPYVVPKSQGKKA